MVTLPSQRKVIEYIFFALISAIASIGVNYARDISLQLESLSKIVADSNTRLEVLTSKFIDQGEVIAVKVGDHEIRLRKIEFSSVK